MESRAARRVSDATQTLLGLEACGARPKNRKTHPFPQSAPPSYPRPEETSFRGNLVRGRVSWNRLVSEKSAIVGFHPSSNADSVLLALAPCGLSRARGRRKHLPLVLIP